MIRVETTKRDVTVHADDEGLRNLANACEEALRGNKVFLGDPGAMLIVRPESFKGAEARGGPDAD